MRQSDLRPELVEFIPERMNEGVLYISKKYRTASHLCCCGCKSDVVTPLNPAKWRLVEHPDGKVSLLPSIGNWSFPCKSHYFVSRNRVEWAIALSRQQIAAVQAIDAYDAVALGKDSRSRWSALVDTLSDVRASFISKIRKLLRR
jgi:hypothetical protein